MIDIPIVLGSASPRRLELLEAIAGRGIQVVKTDVDETMNPNLPPQAQSEHLAKQKMDVLLSKNMGENYIYLTADTVVILENEILGKPKDKEDAFMMLSKLMGKTHQVVTGVVIYFNEATYSFSDSTDVTFSDLSDEDINYYIENYDPLDKAGAYGIQDWIGKVGISRIDGCYYNVMGLPLSKLYFELQSIM